MDIELNSADSEVTVETSLYRISEELGEQIILGGEPNHEFAYLAALALETYDKTQYDVERVVMEFLRNSSSIDLTADECNKIERMLRQ